jgi:hypothetical protein
MKTLIALLALATPSLAQLPPIALRPQTTKAEPAAPVTELKVEYASARHFRLTATSSNAAGTLARGGFYDLAPGMRVPVEKEKGTLLDKPETGIRLSPLEKTWTSAGDVFVRGLDGIADGESWKGMLERDGIYRFETIFGTKTVAAYKLSEAPDPVAAHHQASGKEKRKLPGTTLDQPARR